MSEYVLLAARSLSGLLAGVYFAYAVSVMPALRSMEDHTFVTVMNRINVVIVNPVFLLAFLGAPVLALVVLAWDRDGWAIAAAVLAVLTLVITFAANVPLNDALADGGTREAFENPWTAWNIVRTVTGTASLVCLLRL
jgi:uncharacterized membrane protein